MKTRWLLLVTLASGASCASVEERVVTGLLQDYVEAQQALAADDAVKAKSAFMALAQEAKGELQAAALSGAGAEDLVQARSAFKKLSDKLIAGELPRGYIVAFCPVADQGKGASWIQKDGKIANPYLGEKPDGCAEIKRKGG